MVRDTTSAIRATILINNYNYARFLPCAIESALRQTYRPLEVVVVDDGSTDNSRDIIHQYGSNIIPVLKPNGGQASAFNAGVRAASGNVMFFLDADDIFFPEKLSTIIPLLNNIGISRRILLSHAMEFIDAHGRSTSTDIPFPNSNILLRNDYKFARHHKFVDWWSTPTSGLTITAALARAIFPLPEAEARISADQFIGCAALLVGEATAVNLKLGAYRIHGDNLWFNRARRLPKDFYMALECHLNNCAKKDGLAPVVSYFGSEYALHYLRASGKIGECLTLAAKVLFRNLDLRSLRLAVGVARSCVAGSTPEQWSDSEVKER